MSITNENTYSKFSQLPNIYIPMLFNNITESKLRKILADLNMFTPKTINMESKTLANGKPAKLAFIDVAEWNTSCPNAKRMRTKLMNNEEVKIVFNNPWYFICKRKHEEEDLEEREQNEFRSPEHKLELAPVPFPRNTNTNTNSQTTIDDVCPECEEGVENQMGHSCTLRYLEQEEEAAFAAQL